MLNLPASTDFKTIKRLYKIVFSKSKKEISFFLIIVFLSSFAEMFSVSSIFPFILVISNPKEIQKIPVLNSIILNNNLSDENIIKLVLGLFILSTLIALTLKLITSYFSLNLSAKIGSYLSCEAYHSAINQKYDNHIKSNSSEVIANLTNELTKTVIAINSTFRIFTFSLISLSLVILLMRIDLFSALLAFVVILISYLILVFIVKSKLQQNSIRITNFSKTQLKAVQEGLGGIRDIILDNNQKAFYEIFKKIDKPMRSLFAQNQFIGVFPRYVIETIGLILIAIIAFHLKNKGYSGETELAILGTIALGAQRLLPSIQQIYVSWTELRGNSTSINSVLSLIDKRDFEPLEKKDIEKIKFNEIIEIKNLSFKYQADSELLLKNISFNIKKGERIALVGKTGSGKSTLLDIIMGLLIDNVKGEIKIDGKNLYEKNNKLIYSWRKLISHVPQRIYLSDDSFASNIAFGVSKNDIDIKKVKIAAKKAQIDNFISKTKYGYNTRVGERGLFLSGGQLQRIAIARAFYKEAEILFFDEVTSALDNQTESDLMKSINTLKKDKTIILIAHRLSTIKNFDKIIEIQEGKVKKIIDNKKN